MDTKEHNIDMCNGPLLKPLLLFSLPLVLSGLLQVIFYMADMIVVGRFCSYEALAAVGSTSAVNQLIVNFFICISVGSNVVAANYVGAGNSEKLVGSVHTSIGLAFFGGLAVMALTMVAASPLLRLMAAPPQVLDLGCRFMMVYSLGIPFTMLYNFGSALMRSFGDSRRPMKYITVAGVLNVILNVVFVAVIKIGVTGVAWATVFSQGLAAWLTIQSLRRLDTPWRLRLNRLKPDVRQLKEIIRIGLPTGIQSSCFAISNMLVQSSVNSMGPTAIAGNTAASSVEGITWVMDGALLQAVMTFVAQNHGARKYHRLCRVIVYGLLCNLAITVILCLGMVFFRYPMLSAYNKEQEVIEWGIRRMSVMIPSFLLSTVMDAVAGALRGLKCSIMPMVTTLVATCGFRGLWIWLVFPHYRSMECLMLSYPISWAIILLVTGSYLIFMCHKLLRSPDRID